MGPETKTLIKKSGLLMRNASGEPRSIDCLLQKVSITIQRRNCSCILVTLARSRIDDFYLSWIFVFEKIVFLLIAPSSFFSIWIQKRYNCSLKNVHPSTISNNDRNRSDESENFQIRLKNFLSDSDQITIEF